MSSTVAWPWNSLNKWIRENYAAVIYSIKYSFRVAYVVFAFCSALFIGALKGLIVGPVAGLLLILGNIGVLLGLFPAHVAWTLYSLLINPLRQLFSAMANFNTLSIFVGYKTLKTDDSPKILAIICLNLLLTRRTKQINAALKFAILFVLPILFSLWLALSIFVSVLGGIGYGFLTPWVSTFEAFRHNTEVKKFLHGIVDGTWGTIKGSCTVVRDFADFCYHSYPLYLKELRESTSDHQTYTIRLVEIPGCVVVGLMGLVVDVPLYTVIALIKSPYMLFKGWQRLLQDLITREGPFLETACVPVAGLAFIVWPIVVVGSVLLAIFSSIFVGLYGSVIVYQERSFKRGAAYVVAIVAEFDEYTNDWLYLREGSVLPKPKYRKKTASHSSESSVGGSSRRGVKGVSGPLDASAMFMPSLAPSRSVRETIQEVKMVQIWEEAMKNIEMRGKEIIHANVITELELNEWLRTKENKPDIVGLGLPSYSLLHSLLKSIEAGFNGLLLSNGIEVTHQNRPQDRLLDWFFQPLMVLKEQIRVIGLEVEEVKFLEKLVLFNGDTLGMQSWDNGSVVPQDAMKTAQIQAISRRLVGMSRTISKFPTYRRKYRHVVKALVAYCHDKDGLSSRKVCSTRSAYSAGVVPSEV